MKDRDIFMLFLIAFMIIMQFRICILERVISDNNDRMDYLEDMITYGVDADVELSIKLKTKEH